jgi:hypothetical protein
MKKLIGMLALCAIVNCSYAQDSMKNTMQDTSMGKTHRMKDCIMMKDGQTMIMKDGQKMKLDQSMTLGNGTTVSPDGTVKMTDGTTKMLKEGDCIYMDGKMGKMKMKKKMDKMSTDSTRMR